MQVALRLARRARSSWSTSSSAPRATSRSCARDARYALAERAAPRASYATGHTASDQAETVLYRLAVSPGSRALHGMPARRGRLVRPLLGRDARGGARRTCGRAASSWREDPSNADRRFARARVRHDLLEVLADDRAGGRADDRGDRAPAARGGGGAGCRGRWRPWRSWAGDRRCRPRSWARQLPAVRRLVLRRLAEAAGGELRAGDAERILALGGRGSKSLDLGGGLRAVVEYGTLRFTRSPSAASPRRRRCRFRAGFASATGTWKR